MPDITREDAVGHCIYADTLVTRKTFAARRIRA